MVDRGRTRGHRRRCVPGLRSRHASAHDRGAPVRRPRPGSDPGHATARDHQPPSGARGQATREQRLIAARHLPMVAIHEEPIGNLQHHGEVAIAFEVTPLFKVEPVDAGLGGLVLDERPVEVPWVKDYDVADGGPQSWASRFDVTSWGLLGAYDDKRRIGGAVIAFDTPNLYMLCGRQDLAVLWDLRVVPDARRLGVGSALFRASEAWVRERVRRSRDRDPAGQCACVSLLCAPGVLAWCGCRKVDFGSFGRGFGFGISRGTATGRVEPRWSLRPGCRRRSQAAVWYSWMSPPRMSVRRMGTGPSAETRTGRSSSRPHGGSWSRARWGRCRL